MYTRNQPAPRVVLGCGYKKKTAPRAVLGSALLSGRFGMRNAALRVEGFSCRGWDFGCTESDRIGKCNLAGIGGSK